MTARQEHEIETPRLHGARVLLRELRQADVTARQELGQHPEIGRMLAKHFTEARRWTDAEARAWYEANLAKANPYYWIIEHEQAMIGHAHLYDLNWADRRARYAISLHAVSQLGRGLGSEATQLVLGHAFNALVLHRVDLRVLAFNTRAIACYAKCGFVVEGRERETAWIDGSWQDDVMMSVLDHEHAALAGGEP